MVTDTAAPERYLRDVLNRAVTALNRHGTIYPVLFVQVDGTEDPLSFTEGVPGGILRPLFFAHVGAQFAGRAVARATLVVIESPEDMPELAPQQWGLLVSTMDAAGTAGALVQTFRRGMLDRHGRATLTWSEPRPQPLPRTAPWLAAFLRGAGVAVELGPEYQRPDWDGESDDDAEQADPLP